MACQKLKCISKDEFIKLIQSKLKNLDDLMNDNNITLNINKILKSSNYKNILNFDLYFYKDILLCENIILEDYNLHIIFDKTIFNGKLEFFDIKLEKLEFKDVVFKKHVGIKQIAVEKLIIRPYEVSDILIIDNGEYATKDGLISVVNENAYITHLKFEEPHAGDGKIYITGIRENTNADFKNRNLEKVIFKNCNFENTLFLNAMLRNTKFMNCTFPKINNDKIPFIYIVPKSPILFILFAISFIVLLFEMMFTDTYRFIEIFFHYFVYPFTLPFLGMLSIYSIYYCIVNKCLKFIFKNKDSLIGKHIGIHDENKLGDGDFAHEEIESTISNIKDMYTDIKMNFLNNGDMQKAGDFYHSSNIIKIKFGENVITQFILMMSDVVNGFGERPLRALYSIFILLTILFIIQTPNIDYISTPNTPPFLLSAEHNNTNTHDNNSTYTNYTYNDFQKINIMNYKDNNTYGFDNKDDFNYKEQYIPKLDDKYWLVRFYYATSHITMPFTQENKKWFQNVSEKSYAWSIPITILLWLFIIGMFKAIFNRIKR